MAERTPISPWLTAAALLVVGGLGLSVWLMPVEAEARDSDGSRLGAQEHELGTTYRDSLAPPDDVVDWRYIKVEKRRTVTFSVRVEPTEKAADVTLTRATGDELDSTRSKEGEAGLERELAPGIYYLKVGASTSISYSLTIE